MKFVIVFYDGPCVLCNFWVRKLCRWDRFDRLRFTSLNSAYAKKFFLEKPTPYSTHEAIITWDAQKGYKTEAEAVFWILKQLPRPWKFFLFFQYFPNIITKRLYQFIAQNRYRWFGAHPDCPLPTPNFSHKFL